MMEVSNREQKLPASYEEAVGWINSLIPFGIRPGLDRILMMMEAFGNPHEKLKFIHVAGTNGKGSSCAFLTRTLMECGYTVGTFTSPYITKFTNRFQYNLEDIAEETLLTVTTQMMPVVKQIADSELGSPTMFEVSTAIALVYFASCRVSSDPHERRNDLGTVSTTDSVKL